MITRLTEILPNPLLHFFVLLPLILIAFFKTKSKDYFLILLFFVLIVIDDICLRAWPQIGILNKNWNWIGKISECIFAVSFIYLFIYLEKFHLTIMVLPPKLKKLHGSP